MLPAILGLGGLTAKIIATAVIPRVVRAISQSFSTTRPAEPCPPPPVEGISSRPEPATTPVLSGVSGTRIRSRKWGYAGLWHHAPSGLDLATYRLYDAKNRRWISRDPLGEGYDRTLYSYCLNSPVNLVDPEGTNPGLLVLVVVGLANEAYQHASGNYARLDAPENNRVILPDGRTLQEGGTYQRVPVPVLALPLAGKALGKVGGAVSERIVIDGPKARGGRICGIRPKGGKHWIRIDKHPLTKGGPSEWHYHRWPDLSKHRPKEGL
jgi:RHS repeat-associated protein